MMTATKTIQWMLYLMSFMMFMNKSSLLLYWVLLEINMIMFLMLILNEKEKSDSKNIFHTCFFYFIIQSLGSFLILVTSVMNVKEMTMLGPMIMAWGMMMKMGLLPFHMWIFKISYFLKSTMISTTLTLQKIPVIFMTLNFFPQTMIWMVTWSMISGTILLWSSELWQEMTVSSSIYFSSWLFLISSLNNMMLIIMFYFYFTAIKFLADKEKSEMSMSSNYMKLIILIMFFIGVPPVSIFLMKVMVVPILMMSSKSIIMFMWMTTVSATAGYLKFFWSLTEMTKNHYMMSKKNIKETLTMSIIVSIFMLTLL